MQIGNKIKKETNKLDGIFAHRTQCFTILPFLNSQIFMHFQSRRFSKFQDFWPMEIMPYQRHCLSPKIILLHGKNIILFNIANSETCWISAQRNFLHKIYLCRYCPMHTHISSIQKISDCVSFTEMMSFCPFFFKVS